MNLISAEEVMKDGDSYFVSLPRLCDDDSLTKDQKIEILSQWRYDAIELETAEGESMGGGPPSNLHEIMEALRYLGSTPDSEYAHSKLVRT